MHSFDPDRVHSMPHTGGLARSWQWDGRRVEEPAVETVPVSYVRLYSWTAHMFPSGSSKKQ